MSTPVKRRVLAEVEARGGWDKIVERVASGETLLAISKEFGVSRGFFSWLAHRDDARSDRIKRARVLAAHAAVDEIMEIVDRVSPDRDEIAKAKLQVEARMFVARTSSPAEFAPQPAPQVQVNLSVGQLHLNALRAQAAVQALPEAEVVEEAVAALPPAVEGADHE